MDKIIFLIFTFVLREINCKTVTISQAKFTDNKEYLDVTNVDVKNNKSLTIEFNVIKDLSKPMFHVLIYTQNNGKYTNMVDKEAEFCGLDKNLPPGGFLSAFFKLLFSKSNVEFKCPLKAGSYYIKDFESGSAIPAYIPDIIYKTVLKVTQDFDGTNKEIYKGTYYGAITS